MPSSAGIAEKNSKIKKKLTKDISNTLISAFVFGITAIRHSTQCWKMRKVASVFKKRDRHPPLNCGTTSFTYVYSKIMEHYVYSQVIRFLENKIFLSAQLNAGFSKVYLVKLSWHPSCTVFIPASALTFRLTS